jgi:hypothetical protein
MKDDNKHTDIENEEDQLGNKNENPSIADTLNSGNVNFTPGDTRPMIANIFTKSGITSTPSGKQGAPIQWPMADGKSGPSTM